MYVRYDPSSGQKAILVVHGTGTYGFEIPEREAGSVGNEAYDGHDGHDLPLQERVGGDVIVSMGDIIFDAAAEPIRIGERC